MTAQAQKLLDQLMDNFDFGKVARAMKATGWRWASTEGMGVPTEAEIRAQAREYAQQAIAQAFEGTGHKPQKGFVGTGGFHIEAEREGDELTLLYARFTLTEFVAEPCDD